MLTDTIAAISTPPGEGGIGIVRISGGDAVKILDKIFQPKYEKDWRQVASFTMHLGHIVASNGEVIDEVLVSIMKGPKSFTAEDVVEINCHGGLIPLRLTLETVLNAGARLAEPGEFSKRAFLNGRIDLPQAEAIIDVIRAKSEIGLNSALKQLNGKLSNRISLLRKEILGLLASIEAAIDFPEEDLEEVTVHQITFTAQNILEEIDSLIRSSEHGKFIREGINTAIVGRTNVGKSSLLNALLRENRSIVTDIPGTTRDTIEEFINIGGFSLKIIDTAGIRDTLDVVEKLGVERTKEILESADLVLLVLDIVEGITAEDKDLLEYVKNKRSIVIINKIDIEIDKTQKKEITQWVQGFPHLFISAKEEVGIDRLEKIIIDTINQGGIEASQDVFITNMRHKESLKKSFRHLSEVINAAEAGMTLDFLSIDLRAAWEALGEITGDTAGEDLLDRIFSDFCIGK